MIDCLKYFLQIVLKGFLNLNLVSIVVWRELTAIVVMNNKKRF